MLSNLPKKINAKPKFVTIVSNVYEDQQWRYQQNFFSGKQLHEELIMRGKALGMWQEFNWHD